MKPAAAGSLSGELSALHAEYEAHRRAGAGAAFEPSDTTLRVRDGTVLIDCTAAADGAALQRDLEGLGLRGGAAHGRLVSGWLPIAVIPELAGLASLGLARASRPQTGGSAAPSGSTPDDST